MIRILTAAAVTALMAAPALAQQSQYDTPQQSQLQAEPQSPAGSESWSQDQLGNVPASPESEPGVQDEINPQTRELGVEQGSTPDLNAPQQAQIPQDEDPLVRDRDETGAIDQQGMDSQQELGQSPDAMESQQSEDESPIGGRSLER